MLLPALLSLLPTANAQTFPTDWADMSQGGSSLIDATSDASAPHMDIVGDAQGAAGLWQADADWIYLAMRIDDDPVAASSPSTELDPGSWAFALELDSDPATVDEVVELAGPSPNLTVLHNPGNLPGTSAELDLDTTANDPADWSWEIVPATTSLNNSPDYRIHLAVKRSFLLDRFSVGDTTEFRFALLTNNEYVSYVLDDDLASPTGALADAWTDFTTIDGDQDGLTTPEEILLGSDPDDTDSDNDGVSDYDEVYLHGTDPTACDHDNDGLPDGLELGVSAPLDDTDTSAGCFSADEDTSTVTGARTPDSDNGGLVDGDEDRNSNGNLDSWETDPNDPSDDVDADADGIADAIEDQCDLGGPSTDRDNDGIPDLIEGLVDTDGDGTPDFCDPDSDGDGIPDSEEGQADLDEDGVPNYQDDDSDDDGVPDEDEPGDDDCDGIPDFLDTDDDDACDNPPLGEDGDDYGLFTGGKFTGGACSQAPGSPSLWPFGLVLLAGLRRRRRGWAALSWLLPGAALAGTAAEPLDAQRFEASPGAEHFWTLAPFQADQPGAAFHFNYADDPLVYRHEDGTETPVLGSVGTANLLGWTQLGPFRLGADLPLHLVSSGFGVEGFRLIGDTRLLADAEVWKRDALHLVAGADLSLPTGAEDNWLGEQGIGGGAHLQLAWNEGPLHLAARAGARTGSSVQLGDLVWGPKVPWAAGAAWDATEALSVSGEITGDAILGSKATGRAPTEILGGVHMDLDDTLLLHAGLGTGLSQGVGAPDWRGIVSLGWHPNRTSRGAAVLAVVPTGPVPVRLVVKNEDGLPVAARIRILGAEERILQGNPDGHTTFELARGAHELVVWAEGYRVAERALDLDDADKAVVEVVLQEGRVKIVGDQVRIFEKIYFELDSSEIRRESFPLLDEVALLLMDHPELELVAVEGHTDDQGDDEYNLELSLLRAQAVRHYLVQVGVEGPRLEAYGYGESEPLVVGTSDESRAANRRVEFHIRRRTPAP